MTDYARSTTWSDIGIRYPQDALDLALSRGWSPQAHIDAVLSMDEDAITVTHPFNHLTEEEVEAL